MKKTFLTFRALIYISLSFIIFYNLFTYTNIINLNPTPLENFLSYTPPLLAYDKPNFFLNIFLFIGSILLIFQPIIIKYLKSITCKYLFSIFLIIINLILICFLLLNLRLLLNDALILPSSSIFYYKMMYFLYFLYFTVLLSNIYSNFSILKKMCSN